MPEGIASTLISIAPMLVIVVVFYFVLIRPQQKEAKKTREMLAALKVGDRVRTAGGVYGTLTKVRENTVTVATGPDKVQIVFERAAVKSVDKRDEKTETTEEESK